MGPTLAIILASAKETISWKIMFSSSLACRTSFWDDDSKLSILVTFDYDDTSPIDANSRWYSNNVDHTKYSSIFTDERSSRTPAGNFFGLTTGNSFPLIPGTLVPPLTPPTFFSIVP